MISMFFELIRKRRSIRKFQSIDIEKEKIEKLVEAALRAPSSRGINPWTFIIVNDSNMLKKISKAKPHGSSFLKDSPIGIIVCGDPEQSDTWVEDTSIASVFIQLAAEALGLASCWIQIRGREHNESVSAGAYVKQIMEIPDNVEVESVIAIGYPDEIKPPHPVESLQTEKVFHNGFGN